MVKIINPLNPYDRPGEDYDQDNQAAGDSSDPRGAYDPQATPLGDSSDPTADQPKKRTRAADALRSPINNMAGRGLRKPKDDKKKEEDGRTKKNLNDAENQPGLYNPEDTGAGEASPSDLDDEENNSGLYNPGKDNKTHRGRDFLKRHKKKAAVGGGIFLGLTGGLIGIMSFLLPLKVEHIVDNLENHFFSNANAAIQEEARNMFKEYLITRVMPGYQSCGSTIKTGCVARKFGRGPVADLYRTWSNGNVERHLWKNGKGVKLEYHGLSQTYKVYGPGLSKNGEDVGKNGENLSRTFDNNEEFRDFMDGYMKDNTRWNQVFHRYNVNHGLVGKRYAGGAKFCVISCKLTDPINKKVREKKLIAKAYLAQRVIIPRNEAAGVALLCLIKGPACPATDTQPSNDEDLKGTPQSEYDKNTGEALKKYADSLKLKSATPEELTKAYKEIADVGFQKYFITETLVRFGVSTGAASATADLIPIAGWINLGAQLVSAGDGADGTLKKFNYVVNGTTAAVSLWVTYRAVTDETHTGRDSAEVVGSFAESLGPGDHGEPTDPIKGGTAGAEQVPLYANIIEGKSVAKATAAAEKPSEVSLGGLLQGKTYAASPQGNATSSSTYICNDGKPIPVGELICPEEILGGSNAITGGIHDFLNSCPVPVAVGGAPIFCPKSLVNFADLWNASFGILFAIGGDITSTALSGATHTLDLQCGVPIVGDLSPWCNLKELGQKLMGTIVEGVTTWLIPNPFSTNMSGGRTFDMMAAGADVLGNSTSQTLLGGQKLTNAQRGQIASEQERYQADSFARKPLFARMFDTDSQQSLASKVAMEVPLSKQAAAQGSVATLLNPVGVLSRGFSSIFSGKASADPEAEPDPFGVPQYGYPEGTVPKNPEAYWEANCSDDAAHAYQKDSNSWNESAAGEANADPDNGMPMNKTTNPCLLIRSTIGAAGGLFDASNLTKADLGNVSADGGDSAPGSVAGDTIDLKTLYDSSVDVACAPNTKDLGIADGYHDNKKVKIRICAVSNVPSTSSESSGQYGVTGADGKLIVNSRVSKVIYDMAEAAKKAGISTDADSGFRTMAHQECLYAHTCGSNPAATPGTSNHQMGVAVDWGEPMYTWMANGNGAKFGFKALVGGEPWHWSPTGN